MLRDGSLLKAYLITLQPLALGIVLCAVAGIGFGIGMGLSRSVEWLSLPIFIILQAAPMAAIIPLITYIYGIGLTSKVLAVIMLAAPVIVMNSYKGIRNTAARYCRCAALSRHAAPGSHEDRAAPCRGPHFHRPAARPRHGLHRHRHRRAPDHAHRHRRPHHLQQLGRRLSEMFAAIASIVALAASALYLLERLERRWFP